MKKLFLIDAYALIFRSYYAFIGRPMRNREGVNTSAVFGFVRFLHEILKRESPHYLGVAFDPPGGNFRHQLYEQYKANRSETPEEIKQSVPYIKRILEAMRIPILEVPGYEADDVIGTLSAKAACHDFEVYMVTPDKDFGQLVQPCVYIYKPAKGDNGVEIVGTDGIHEQYGIDDPKLVIDILALWGDSSDNIPGVPGIGEKGAVKLVCQWGPVENIIAHAGEIKGKTGENIAAHAEQIALSKKLATIELDAPVEFEPEKLVMETPDLPALKSIYEELNFSLFVRELEALHGPIATAQSTAGTHSAGPADLFNATSAAVSATKPVPVKATAPPVSAGPQQGDLFGGGAPAPGETWSPESGIYETIRTVPHTYYTVTAEADLKALAEKLSRAERFCFDTETTGFDPFTDRLVGFSVAVEEFEAYYIPLPADRDAAGRILALFKPAFESSSIEKVAQNEKFDRAMLRAYGINVQGFVWDTMLMHYLVDPDTRHGMDFLAKRYLEYDPVPIDELIGKGSRQLTMDMIPVEKVSEYAAEDADVTLRLYNKLLPLLEERKVAHLYKTIEEPLIAVLEDMEWQGVKIDVDSLKSYGKELSADLVAMEDEIRKIAGNPTLNVNSAKQLGEVLFEQLKIDPAAKRTKTKQYRTDEEYLQSLSDRHPVIHLILEYRGLKKLLSTYIEALPELVNPVTGKIHTSFNQAVASTGRLSSNNPNLQNIPIRDERGRQLRKAFIPSEAGCVLLSADYSQVELRLMAHLSGDPAMIEDFLAGKDIHAATAARLFHVPVEEVTREQRRRAKTANFGIIYGISAFGLAQRLTIPRKEAQEIIEGYFSTYPGVQRYIDQSILSATDRGYVETLFGRKRWLPDLRSANATVRGLAQRNAINAPIQGGAADIIKLAMIHLHQRLEDEKLRSKIILQVHDELVLNVFENELDTVKKLTVDAMERAAKLAVPLLVDCGVGDNWLDAH